MAKLVTNIQETDKTAQGKSFDRMEALPLDSTSIWTSKTSLDAYASSLESSSQTTSYVGQVVTCINTGDQTIETYVIQNTDGALHRLTYDGDAPSFTSVTFDTDCYIDKDTYTGAAKKIYIGDTIYSLQLNGTPAAGKITFVTSS